MKALSIRQPWAWLIVHGGKDIENRTWATKYRGPVLIHTGKKINVEAHNRLVAEGIGLPPIEDLETGGIIGRCNIADCVTQSESKWFGGPFGFVLENQQPMKFRLYKGKLYFFNVI